jgi:ribose 1,5-bisphosphokinase
MSGIVQTRNRPADESQRIGDGRIVLVVGPSGAGKDTLLGLAREQCHRDPEVMFPRRFVTRAAIAGEHEETVSETGFEELLTRGAFALWWRAHGLSYGVPRSIDADVRAGRTVVCNVSRTIVEAARARYARVNAVLVTAPADVLAARLAQRGREAGDALHGRLRRTAPLADDLRPDFIIENIDRPDVGAKGLLDVIYQRTFMMAR